MHNPEQIHPVNLRDPVFLADQADVPREYEEVPREFLKHGRGKYSNVILVPQPSDSPNDPLNVSHVLLENQP